VPIVTIARVVIAVPPAAIFSTCTVQLPVPVPATIGVTVSDFATIAVKAAKRIGVALAPAAAAPPRKIGTR
jgi:hypothetical protein